MKTQETPLILSAQRLKRIYDIQNILIDYPEGLTTAEIARRIGDHSQRTIQRDLLLMHQLEIGLCQSGRRYSLDHKNFFLPPLRLNLDEATALFLAARLLTICCDEYNEAVEEAFRKLAGIMPGSGVSAHLIALVKILERRHRKPGFMSIFRTITWAWVTGEKVRLV